MMTRNGIPTPSTGYVHVHVHVPLSRKVSEFAKLCENGREIVGTEGHSRV